MLERAFTAFRHPDPPRHLAKLQDYLDNLRLRMQMGIERHASAPGGASQGVRLLVKTIADADVASLNSFYPSDLERYSNRLAADRSGLERIFDPVVHGKPNEPLFIDCHGGWRPEYLIPTQLRDPLSGLPLDQGWEAWREVQPLRVFELDSLELTFETHADRLRYHRQPPRYAIYGIDVAALVLQYACFRRTFPADLSYMTIEEYLHRFVLNKALISDATCLWLRGQYLNQLGPTPNDPAEVVRQTIGAGTYGQLGGGFVPAMEQVAQLVRQTKEGTVTPKVLLSSLLAPNGQAIGRFWLELGELLEVADYRQELWVGYLRDRLWLELILRAHELAPTAPATQQLLINLKRDVPLLRSTRFWSVVRHELVRQVMEADVNSLVERVMTLTGRR